MFNIKLDIKPANETLITEQLNDPICGGIGDVYDKLSKLRKLYYDNRSINKREFTSDVNLISKEFSKVAKERFGIDIKLRDSNTFAVIPIFNPDDFDKTEFTVGKADLKHGMKQIETFLKWLDTNELILDKKHAVFLNMPKEYYVPLFINVSFLKNMDREEFVAIILHETGHVFTLLEAYTSSTATTSVLISNFLRNKTIVETTKDLKITKAPKSEEDGINLILDKVSFDIRNIGLGGHGTGETNPEVEADNFATKFGYGEQLSTALVKLNEVDMLSFSNASAIILLMSVVGMAMRALLLAFVIPGGLLLMAVIALEIGLTLNSISRLLALNNKRNPINDEHGSLKQRIEHINTSVIEMIRLGDLNKKDTKLMLRQYDSINRDMELIEKSAHGKVLIGLISEYLVGNLNTEDELASKLNMLENSKLYVHEARFMTGLEVIKKDEINDAKIPTLEEFAAGNEAMGDNGDLVEDVENTVYYKSLNLWSKRVEHLLQGNDIENLNIKLKPYGIGLDNKNDELLIKTNRLVKVADGITGFAVFETDSEKHYEGKTVVSVTIDSDKIIWLLKNPYIDVYNLDMVIVGKDNKAFYIIELEYLRSVSDKKDAELINKIQDINADLYRDYGDLLLTDNINKLLTYDKKHKFNKEITEQLNLIVDMVELGDINDDIHLDIHSGNWGVNLKGKIVMLDPIYNSRNIGLKRSNILDITKYKDYIVKIK